MRSEGGVVTRERMIVFLLLGVVSAFALFVPNFQDGNRTKGPYLYGGWPLGPAQDIEPDIVRIFGCTLEKTARQSQCMSHRTRGLASLDIDPMHGEAVKFTAMVLVSRDDVPSPAEERVSADTTMQIVDYFFPDWPERRQWMSLALRQARDRHANSVIKLGDAALSVAFEVPQGVAAQSTFAFITIKQAASR
jgi:hypothetical protein